MGYEFVFAILVVAQTRAFQPGLPILINYLPQQSDSQLAVDGQRSSDAVPQEGRFQIIHNRDAIILLDSAKGSTWFLRMTPVQNGDVEWHWVLIERARNPNAEATHENAAEESDGELRPSRCVDKGMLIDALERYTRPR